MLRQTLALIKIITMFLPDPPRAERAMINLVMCSFKLCKKVLTKDLLSVLAKRCIGTNEVENCVKKLCRSSVRMDRDNEMIKFIMNRKLRDATYQEREVRKEYKKRNYEYNQVVPKGCITDLQLKTIMGFETDKIWRDGKVKNKNKINHLTNKYHKKGHIEERIRNIRFRDVDLGLMEVNENLGNEPRLYGGIEIANNARNVLCKDPNYMMLDPINSTEIEVEIEKGLAKARYELMGRSEDEDSDGSKDGEGGTDCQVEPNKTLNYANLRATDIPTVSRLHPPKPASIKKEKIMDNIKEKLLDTVFEYKKEHCDNKGRVKDQNITSDELKAIKEIKEKIKDKEMVVFTTDKSGRFSVDTPTNYEEALMDHTMKDIEVGHDKVKQIENTMNHHMKQFNRMFNVGSAHNHESRVTSATHSTNMPAPPLYGLRKDHKVTENMTKGPPVRPVCGADQAPNSRLGNFLSRIVNDFADAASIDTECRSSEEMRAAFEQYNNNNPEVRKKCAVLSMDVKALYPSMDWEEIIVSVREMIENSKEDIENVDYNEIGKYLAVTLTEEDIAREGLEHVVPKRKVETGRSISVAYLCNKSNEDKWQRARPPGNRQKKRMVALAVAEGVRACMANHVYCVGDKIFMQTEGGPIGLELTGAVSRAFMARWDRLYLKKVKKAGMKMMLYERYVDDSNQMAEVPPPGSKYDQQKQKVVVDTQIQDHHIPADERLAKILLVIANSVMSCIGMEADWPSRNEDKRMPILDMKAWTNEEGILLYQHYEKEVSKKTVLHARSAHSSACKRGVHTQEVVRRLLNSSHKLNWEVEVAPVITEYMRRMKIAGYGEQYRKDVLTHALGIYDKKWEADSNGSRPIFRPKTWKKEERKKEKERKKHDWAMKDGHIAPIFVPTTPGGTLMKRMREVAEKEAREGIRFKIVEVGGRTLKSELQRSNPTATPGCDKEDCLGCNVERGKGGKCHKNNVNYEIECHLCPEGNRPVYIGETSRNLYTRCKEHIGSENSQRNDHNEDNESSFVRKHMETSHAGMTSKFVGRITHANKDSLSRQVREGVLIRRSGREMLNTKSEWFQPPIYRVRNDIVRE